MSDMRRRKIFSHTWVLLAIAAVAPSLSHAQGSAGGLPEHARARAYGSGWECEPGYQKSKRSVHGDRVAGQRVSDDQRFRERLGVRAGLSSGRKKLRRGRAAAATRTSIPPAIDGNAIAAIGALLRAASSSRCLRMRIWTSPATVGNAIVAITRTASSAFPSRYRRTGT